MQLSAKKKKNNNNFVCLNCAFKAQNKEEINLFVVKIVTREEKDTVINEAPP